MRDFSKCPTLGGRKKRRITTEKLINTLESIGYSPVTAKAAPHSHLTLINTTVYICPAFEHGPFFFKYRRKTDIFCLFVV
jgi:hypothetical protein